MKKKDELKQSGLTPATPLVRNEPVSHIEPLAAMTPLDGDGSKLQATIYGVESLRPGSQGLAMAAGSGLAAGYDAGRWAGHDHFKCLTCPYDTFSEDEMVAHVELGQHIVPQAHVEPETQDLPARHEAAVVDTPDGQKLVGIYAVDLKEVQDGTNDAD